MPRLAATVLIVASLVGLPLSIAFGIHQALSVQEDNKAASAIEPLFIPAVEEAYSGSLDAVVTPTWEPPVSLTVQQERAGIITSASLAPGQELESGAVAYDVDGQPTVALHTAAPLYRDLHVGDEGPDVFDLESALAALGHFADDPDETYDDLTDAAVQEWLGAHRVQPPGAGVQIDAVLWLPDQTLQIGVVGIAVGEQAPAPGEVVAMTDPHLRSAVVSASEPPTVRGVEFILRTGNGMASFTWPANVDGREVEITGVAAESIGAVLPRAGETEEGEAVPVRIELAAQVHRVVIPASAIVVGPSGTTCAWVRSGDGTLTERTIVPGSAGFGGAAVLDGIEVGEDVMANPLGVKVVATCE